MDNFSSKYERNAAGEYLQFSGILPSLVGLTEPFDATLKLRDSDLPPIAPLADDIQKHCQKILKSSSQKITRSTTWTKVPGHGWVCTTSESMKSTTCTLIGSCHSLSASVAFPLWYKHLDIDNRRLYQPATDSYLHEREIKILRGLLMGWERQAMADAVCLSVHSIDKILVAMKKYPTPGNVPFLQGMAECGLSSFLLAHENWFAKTGYSKEEKT
mgnify:CR=1 FL=1|tara:strand:+ start:782 stop:1426 length:645 start_codon:yes stop_codon:yes gene_type:complete